MAKGKSKIKKQPKAPREKLVKEAMKGRPKPPRAKNG